MSPEVTTIINNTPVILLYSESLLLPYRNCSFDVKIEVREYVKWIFRIVFTDDVQGDLTPGTNRAIITSENDVSIITITHSQWYNASWIESDYHEFISNDKETTVYCKVRTIAERSIDTRSAQISIWRNK